MTRCFMSDRKLHGMTQLPPGKKVGDVLPIFSGITQEVFAGKPNLDCASCRKPFTAVRKRRKAVRMYPVRAALPAVFSFDICGRCLALYRKGGADRDGVLAAVEAYCEGIEVCHG